MSSTLSCAVAVFLHILCKFCTGVEASELVFVNVIWRHGSRSPTQILPNNTNNWPEGLGQLTKIGMKQQYELGHFFRNKYGKFLSQNYFPNETYVQSSHFDRTFMSAECNMAGLYPPKSWQIWNGSGTNWQPIPIHYVPHDNLLKFDLTNPKWEEIVAKVRSSQEYKALELKYKPFLAKVANWTNSAQPLTVENSWRVRDVLICERSNSRTLPQWATGETFGTLDDIDGLDIGIMTGGVNYQYREQIAPYAAGPLVTQIIDNMLDRIQNKTTYKFFAYSAHEFTLAGVLVAFEAYNWLSPPFASCIMFELYKMNTSSDDLDSYVVKAFYKNSTASPIPIKLLGCDFSCPLSQLIDLTSSITSSQQVAYVLSPTAKTIIGYTHHEYQGTALLIVIVLLLLSWMFIIMEACRLKKSKDVYRDNDLAAYQPLTSYEDLNVGDV